MRALQLVCFGWKKGVHHDDSAKVHPIRSSQGEPQKAWKGESQPGAGWNWNPKAARRPTFRQSVEKGSAVAQTAAELKTTRR